MYNFYMDAHMHFDLYKNREDTLNYIELNKSYTIAMTNLPELFQKYEKRYNQYKYIKIALGFHPELVYNYSNQISLFLELCHRTRYIGEVGLDFSNEDEKNKYMQKQIFNQIIMACNEKKKIMSIHSRGAAKDVIESLKGYEGKAILHWYTGTLSDLNTAIERGYYFSINHQMLKNKSGRNIINKIPVNKLLIESDAPFTYGMNKKYTIEFSEEIYKYLSVIYKENIDIIKKRIKINFKELISLE